MASDALKQSPADRQTEARATARSLACRMVLTGMRVGDKWLKDLLELIGRDSAPGVLHLYDHLGRGVMVWVEALGTGAACHVPRGTR